MHRLALALVMFLALFSFGAAQPATWVIVVYPSPGNPGLGSCDGDIGVNVDPSFQTAHSIADEVDCSTSSYVTAETSVGDIGAGPNYSVIRGLCNFDTSGIGANATILSAIFSIKVSNVHMDFTASDYVRLVSGVPLGNSYAVGDFNTLGTAPLAADIYLDGLPSNFYLNFVLNSAGRAAINKTGVTRFGLRTGLDIANTPPIMGTNPDFPNKGGSVVFFYSSENPGTSSDPKLQVTFLR